MSLTCQSNSNCTNTPPFNQSVGIIGCGAMGLLFATQLYKQVKQLYLYEKEPAVLRALNDGITLIKDGITTTHPLQAESDFASLHKCELIFLFVKSYDTLAVIREIAPYLAANAVVVTLQNGLNHQNILEQELNQQIVYGTTAVGAAKNGHATVVAGGIGDTIIGGTSQQANQRVKMAIKAGGFPVAISDRIKHAIWEKAIINAAINPIATLLNTLNGELLTIPAARKLQEQIVTEAVLAASFCGIELELDALLAKVEQVCKTTATNSCSMRQDILYQRPTEINSINGEISSIGIQHKHPLPFNQTVTMLIQGLQQKQKQ